jgi:hypothetical protein
MYKSPNAKLITLVVQIISATVLLADDFLTRCVMNGTLSSTVKVEGAAAASIASGKILASSVTVADGTGAVHRPRSQVAVLLIVIADAIAGSSDLAVSALESETVEEATADDTGTGNGNTDVMRDCR